MASTATAECPAKMARLQTLCRNISNSDRSHESINVTIDEFRKLAQPVRLESSHIEKESRNYLLIQMTTISILATQSHHKRFCDIMEKLIDEDVLILSLIDCLLADDPFVHYIAVKALNSMLSMYQNQNEEPKHWQLVLFQDIVAHIGSVEAYSHLATIFNLAHKLLQRCHNLGMQCHVITTIGSGWRFYMSCIVDIVHEYRNKILDHDANKFDTVVSFLRLWKRLIVSKRGIQQKLQDISELSETSPMAVPVEIHDDLLKLHPRLLDILWLTRKSYMVQTRVLDVMNAILTYFSRKDRETRHIRDLGKSIIASINKDLFNGIDFNYSTTFSWSTVQPTISSKIYGKVVDKNKRINKFMLRKVALVACNAGMETLDASRNFINPVIDALEKTSALGNKFNEIENIHKTGLLYWIKEVFMEQDDDYVQVLISLLSITIDQRQLNFKPTRDRRAVDIHILFCGFCKAISYSTSLLLDLLISKETLFLFFFTKYLKLLIADWEMGDRLNHSSDRSDIHTPHGPIRRAASIMLDSKMSLGMNQQREGSIIGPASGESTSVYSYYLDYESSECPDFNMGLFSCVSDMGVSKMSESESDILFHSRRTLSRHKSDFAFPKRQDSKDMMAMFARLMLSLQKLRNTDTFTFNINPLIRLLSKVQNIRPYTLRGYVRLREQWEDD